MTEVIAAGRAAAPRPRSCPGPSFAADVASGLPTAVTLAARDEALARALAQALGSDLPPLSLDRSCAASRSAAPPRMCSPSPAASSSGRGLGASAAAALTARGFAELMRFGARARRAAGDPDGPVRPRRSGADLLDAAIAQFRLRRSRSARGDRRWRRRGGPASPKASPPRPVLIDLARAQTSTCRSSRRSTRSCLTAQRRRALERSHRQRFA